MSSPAHQRSTSGEEDEDIDPLVDQQGCGKVYAKLEVCLGENNRDWRACQKEVHALQACYAKSQRAAQAPKSE
ncbi:hypothetical protein WJX72_009597 [[Myrmecia] bisecta]|uniref:CHCH domain-containing protein n=1 Tax=[Myrmecia] bisecta TaxID=41462 RepID=A0AAW1R9M5_9CHLO